MAALKQDSSESESDDEATTHRSVTGMKETSAHPTDLHLFSLSVIHSDIYSSYQAYDVHHFLISQFSRANHLID